MPVRIYEIAKKLSVENKLVLAKAKELGITNVRVPSSSLDKITAEYLEDQIRSTLPPGGITPVESETKKAAPKKRKTKSTQKKKTKTTKSTTIKKPEAKEADTSPETLADKEPEEIVKHEEVETESITEKTEEEPTSTPSVASPEPAAEEQQIEVSKESEEIELIPESTEEPLQKTPEPTVEPAQPTTESTQAIEKEAQQIQEQEIAEQTKSTETESETEEIEATGSEQTSTETDDTIETAEPMPAETTEERREKDKPEEPEKPATGEKVGFIQLPHKPSPKIGEKVGSIKLPPRPPSRIERAKQKKERKKQDKLNQRQQTQNGAPGKPSHTQQKQQFQKQQKPERKPAIPSYEPPKDAKLVTMKPPIIVRQLAQVLNRKPFQIIADLMEFGEFANVNQAIDETTAKRLSAKYGFRFELEKRERGAGIASPSPTKSKPSDIEDKPEDLKPRPPVITIMGHVDHGKTTLLDAIRKSNVVATEAGEITQHIGAYTISIPNPDKPKDLCDITFLDTPGHEAFSAMRARGADVTDIVILVIAADDGVMPQTIEALNHARAAKVPIIVAINKCDHPAANPLKVRQQLQERNVVCEEWGGETIFQDVSALSQKGVDRLLEMILLQAEMMELKANPTRRAIGNVVESGIEAGGPTTTLLVRKGTLKVSDAIICGTLWGKARALIDHEGKRIKSAGPSTAVKVLGLNGVPPAGQEFAVVENDKVAKSMVEEKLESGRRPGTEGKPKMTLENLYATLAPEENKVLKVVLKADTQGSLEAIADALKKIESKKVSLDILHTGVGAVSESDVILSSASKAIIIGFHTRIENSASEAAKREGVQIKLYSIIYELIDDIRNAMAGMLEPVFKPITLGSAEVRRIFNLSKGGPVAGCMIVNGRFQKGRCRVIRNGDIVYEGMVQTLRRFQDEVNEVRNGMECGIRVDGFGNFQEGDKIESFTLEKVNQQL
ncbi:MAG: translation initiation factor IF-2 [Verrucomicrobia bacterium]|nr:translation initiation factor IF-2 [Verrucomicrobiota bacterium]MCF7709091.1 translation initiation factor IF-2 [Verrucomicrobiota bacterium]